MARDARAMSGDGHVGVLDAVIAVDDANQAITSAVGLPHSPPTYVVGPVYLMPDDAGEDAARQMRHDLRHGYGGHRPSRRPRLYTATIMHSATNLMFQAFHASVACSRREIAARLAARHGAAIAADADIRVGFHQANPLSVALVPGAVAEVIRKIEADTSRAINQGFAVNIEQRIEA